MSNSRRAVPTSSAAAAHVHPVEPERGGVGVELCHCVGGGRRDVHGAEPARAVRGLDHVDVRVGRVDHAHAPLRFDHEDHVDDVGVGHEPFGGRGLGLPRAVSTTDRDGRGGVTRRQAIEQTGRRRAPERNDERHRSAAVAKNGPGGRRSRPCRGTGTDRCSRPCRAPRSRGSASTVARPRRGRPCARAAALAGTPLEHSLCGLPDQFLTAGEREVHSYLGRPSTRWAMMLRWISLVPPAMVLANDVKKLFTKRPSSSAKRGR